MRMVGIDTRVEHGPDDSLTAGVVSGMGRGRVDGSRRIAEESAFSRVMKDAVDRLQVQLVRDPLDLEAREIGRNILFQLLDLEFLCIRATGVLFNPRDYLLFHFRERSRRLVVDGLFLQLDQDWMPVFVPAIFHHLDDIAGEGEGGDALEKIALHGIAHRLAHIFQPQVTRTGMRIFRTVQIPTQHILHPHSVRTVFICERLVRADRIDRVSYVYPAPDAGRHGKRLPVVEFLQLILNLGKAERRADGNKELDLGLRRQ